MYVIVNKDFTSVLTEINRFYSIKYLSHRYNVKVFNSRYRAWRDMIRQVLSPDPFRGYGGKIVKLERLSLGRENEKYRLLNIRGIVTLTRLVGNCFPV